MTPSPLGVKTFVVFLGVSNETGVGAGSKEAEKVGESSSMIVMVASFSNPSIFSLPYLMVKVSLPSSTVSPTILTII
ncbi:hypothetical protein D3C80_1483250 [compost metagenome]